MPESPIEKSLNEALALHRSGRLADAQAIYRAILDQRPTHADSLHLLGYIGFQTGDSRVALTFIQQAININPGFAVYHNNLGAVLEKLGRTEEAGAAYRTALRLDPSYAEAHNNLGNTLQILGRANEAKTCFRSALQHRPDYFPAHFNLGNLLKEEGRLEEAIACYRRAVELKPDAPAIHSNLLLALHYQAGVSTSDLADEHRRWSTRHAQPLKIFHRKHLNTADEKRPLRIGYVSPDFRNHPVARFMLPLLQHHDSSQFEVFAYADVPAPDSVSAQVEAHVRVWRNIAGMEDSELADLVRSDQIDILVDLAAHTAGGRLLAFARKPAPVQVNYLAYCSTTGLDAIDYRLTDPFLDPEGVELSDYCEKSIYLPKTYWCYSVPGVSLPVRPRPAEQAGTVTFGCLNNFCKVTNDTLRVWGRLLALVPNSRLLIYARMSSQRRRVEDVMGAFGVDGSRIKSIDYQSFENYLATYHQIDIGLDPIPFTGGSTTCDALWMGVPVVSLAGRTAVSRGGLSLLSNVGLPELVAGSEDDYVRIAAELAEDWPRLALMRQGLRARLKASPIMDPTRFARDIETAFREMWRIWCQNTLRPI